MDKRTQIFEAALKLFVEFGFHGTPTSKIAQEAGVANGTLFHYFPTKDDLIIALFKETKGKMIEYVAENSVIENTLKGILKGQYLSTLYWAMDNKLEFRFVEQFKTSPYLTMIASEEMEKHLKPLFEMLNKGIDDKIIKPLPLDLMLSLISSHTYGLNNYLVNNDFSKAKQHQIISDTFELIWEMISLKSVE
ncbi:TetR family transcriptional regulator [Arcicella aurantiaca]|uniref:TetR family transcriptional regulator n=1 Tax=Arcicella aurantiaca TaxID=591202 RepID=A0A316E9G5_9BACT|nr:TetR/AcrR family transcriptional regulator [Arcicella aurantiaca]PWK27140.1 TetR family transcriptional regulator [Arcicella aurantiaca]